ncbi:MAG: hypothetical protein FRX49_12329 [Trebouxia sp. A1-2]|nr:MAG: hypothetical protein FRX49_12329 [Trebouxia sp. A1-2]
MTSVQSGLLAPATVEKLLTREYDEERRPGLYSETGKKWLEEHKGSHVALLVSQCFKREADWQVTSSVPDNELLRPAVKAKKKSITASLKNDQVSPQEKPLLDSLYTLYQICASAPQMQAPNKKHEMDDNPKEMGAIAEQQRQDALRRHWLTSREPPGRLIQPAPDFVVT